MRKKVFALQYIAADGGSKVTYRSEVSEEQWMKAACKRRERQFAIKDSTASLGPPDKKQHFDNSQVHNAKAQTNKGKSKIGNKGGKIDMDNGRKHEVEVRYQDSV